MKEDLSDYLADYTHREQAAIRLAMDRKRIVTLPTGDTISYDEYAMWQAGAEYQQERIHTAATMAMGFGGNLVEIGSFLGETTAVLAPIAKAFGRKLIVIDPYEVGTQNCAGGEYEIFKEQIAPYKKTVVHIRDRSQSKKVRAQLEEMEIAFAFVDGLHTYTAARDDIAMVCLAPVIAVDDMNMAPVRLAFDDMTQKGGGIHLPYLREAYIVR